MTVKELINILSKHNEDAEIRIEGCSDDYGTNYATLWVEEKDGTFEILLDVER